MTYTYEYELDGDRVDRWHVPSERGAQLRQRVGDEFTAIRRAQADFAKLANMAAGKGRTITAVWHFGNGRRVPLGDALARRDA
jgi:hypothetical protein